MSSSSMPAYLAQCSENPCFTYTERFKCGYVHTAWSVGGGMFFDKKPDNAIGQPSFAVYVNRAELTLSIDIHSERLKSLLVDLKLLEAQCAIMPLYDLLLGYKSLTSSLTGLEKDGPSSQWNDCLSEIRLFASDFLLDRSIFATFGLENLYSLGLLDPSHWQDMERYATLRDMDEIDEAVGFVSDNDDNDNTDTPDGTELLDSATLLKIQHAIRYDDLSCVQRLLNGQFGQVDANTLDISLRRGQLEIFEALLYHGGIIDGDSSNFLSEPLYTATKRGHFDAVIALLKYGACVNGAGHRCSYTPLCGAASGGFLPIVELLHSYGADINGNHVKTPLVAAAKHGHISVVQYLWDNGADINRETSCYGSAITVAVEHRQYGVIKYLVERGADVNLRPNLDGSSWLSDRLPLTAAVKYSDYEMSKFLLNSGATCEELDLRVALKAACKSRQSEIALELFSYGAAMGDIEKNYLLSCSWKLLHSCTDPRKALELASLHYRIQQQPAISTPMSWYDHLSFIYNGNSDRLFCYEIYETNRIWPPTDFERKAQLWHAIQQREPECRQRTMGIRLRRAFAAIYGRLLKRSTELSTSEAFASFVLKFGSAATAWKKGTFAIRKLIDRCVPQSLSEVISCLLVADAIKTVNMLNKSFQTREEALCQFVGDLSRWRLLLQSQDEKILYDKIVHSVWGSPPAPRYDGEGDSSVAANMEYLQSLVSHLTSETSSLTGHRRWSPGVPGGYRLHSMQYFFNTKEPEDTINDNCRGGKNGTFFADEKNKPPDGGNRPNAALWEYATASQQTALMLMAGAVFGMILAFLVVLRLDIQPSAIWTGISSYAKGALTNGEILARNCALLDVYLGLHGVPAPMSTPGTEEAGQPLEAGFSSLQDQSMQYEHVSQESQARSGAPTKSLKSQAASYTPSQLGETLNSNNISPGSSTPSSITPKRSSTVDSSSASAKARPTCSLCSKTFSTTTNRNKHLKFDCPKRQKIRFRCRKGCTHHFSREEYRNRHEQERCKAARRLNISIEGPLDQSSSQQLRVSANGF